MRKYFRIWIFLALGCSRALCFDIQHFYCQKCKCGVKWTEWGKHYSDKHPSYKIPLFLFYPLEKHSRTDGKAKNYIVSPDSDSNEEKAKEFLTPHVQADVDNNKVKFESINKHIKKEEEADPYITYDFFCNKCNLPVPRHLWELHLTQMHLYTEELYNRIRCSGCKSEVKPPCEKKAFLNFEAPKKNDNQQKNSGLWDGGVDNSDSIIIQSYTIKKSSPGDSDQSCSGCSDTFEDEYNGDKDYNSYRWKCPNCKLPSLDGIRFVCKICGENQAKNKQKCAKEKDKDKEKDEDKEKDKTEKKDFLIPYYLGLEHLLTEHNDKVNECLSRSFYCKGCRRKYETAKDWGAHVTKCQNRLKKEAFWKVFYCPKCKEYPTMSYEEHVSRKHEGQCIYCSETLKDKNPQSLGQHMKKAHKIVCPFCKKCEFEVPLEVHIARDHEIWEGPCPFDRCREVCCGKCSKVIEYYDKTKSKTSPVQSFYSDIAINALSDVQQHSAECEATEGKTCIKESEKLKEKFNGSDEKTLKANDWYFENGNVSIQKVKPCESRSFRCSGWYTMLGHSLHSKDVCRSCPYCKNLLIPKDDDKWYTIKEALSEHWKLCHANIVRCMFCNSFLPKGNYDDHLSSDHGDKCWKCPECNETVRNEDLHHGTRKHGSGVAFCNQCKRVGTGSCPNCGEWVFKQCEKCPQRVYGMCPQCKKTAFGSCSECRQYVIGQCSECKAEANGKCLKCHKEVSGTCPICGETATGRCSKCMQRVVGTCSACKQICNGFCLTCKQNVGSVERIYRALKSHKHKLKLNLSDNEIKQFEKDPRAQFCSLRWCEACGIPVKKGDETAHCRDRHTGSCRGWCEICKWDFDGTLNEHLKNIHSTSLQWCEGCGLYVSKNLDKRHWKHHIFNCILCNKEDVPFEHMIEKHGCLPGCKPIVDCQNKVWDNVNHDTDCKHYPQLICNFPECKTQVLDKNFSKHLTEVHGCKNSCSYTRNGCRVEVKHDRCRNDTEMKVSCEFCEYSGNGPDIRKHMREKHGCIDGKCFFSDGKFEHAPDCGNFIVKCPIVRCDARVARKNRMEHIKAHGCIEKCIWDDKGIRHDPNCGNVTVACPFGCGFFTKNGRMGHIYEKHECIEDKCTYVGENFIHDPNCGNVIVVCPFGCRSLPKNRINEHLYNAHGCVVGVDERGVDERCFYKKNGDVFHVKNCPNRVFERCPICKTFPVTNRHLSEKHQCNPFCHYDYDRSKKNKGVAIIIIHDWNCRNNPNRLSQNKDRP